MPEVNVDKQREYLVVKSNELIQRSRYSMPLSMQKAFAFICSLIRPPCNGKNYIWPNELLTYVFDIRDYCNVCGIDYASGGSALRHIKRSLKALADESIYIDMDDNKEVLCRWIDYISIEKRTGTVTVTLGKHLAPYLFNLKEKFTEYELWNILLMKSAYSIRLYELLKSYVNKKEAYFTVEELRRFLFIKGSGCRVCRDNNTKKCLCCDEYKKSYKEFKEFKKKVLSYAVTEINDLSDLVVTMNVCLSGHTAKGVHFGIKLRGQITHQLHKHLTLRNLKVPGKERINIYAKNYSNIITESSIIKSQS